MFTLVTGGSGSGKSSYAEEILSSYGGVKYYLATMRVYDKEGERKVLRHRRLREGKKFLTIESHVNIGYIQFDDKDDDRSLLLECMSNLTANEMFKDNKILNKDDVVNKIINDITLLSKKVDNIIIVTNNVFEDGIVYDDGTMRYLEALAQINIKLAEIADRVIEVVVGIPVELKTVLKVSLED